MKNFTEEDIKYRYITPAIENSGWIKEQVFMEYFFTDGQMIVRGDKARRGKRKKCDYLLTESRGQIPLAIIEAKDESHEIGSGMQQAIDYAEILDIPFAYSSNGKGFIEHDFLTGKEKEIPIDDFPTEKELWNRYIKANNFDDEQEDIITEPDYFDPFSKKKPRYYQRIAIQKTVEAVAKNKNRILLVMATGTGKTYTAFQIIWKLLKTRRIKKVLYLADRNILIDQTMQQDFSPFEGIMTKIKYKELDSAYEVYMSLYHQLAGEEGNEPFRDFKPEFFDLIIVDEAHRGSAKAESQWRRILDYFSPAVQIGMTATPKETKYVSNIDYFGEPIYTYSLKQGIQDGFLAPYKVMRVNIDRDLEGWRPYNGQTDKYGNVIDDREYNIKDYDRQLILDERTKEVAKRITEWLKENGRFSKTIVFCVDIPHAERMRQALINENSDLVKENSKYIMRITGDNDEGKKQLDYFIDINSKYPSIATTSMLMTTGVDAKTTKLIVLDKNINSMTEFKQIIGRGTRLLPQEDKNYFTIMDFRNISRHFADPDFDGEPIQEEDYKPGLKPESTTKPPLEGDVPEFDPPKPIRNNKFYVDGVEVTILNERVLYYDTDGKLITESIKDYSKKNILNEYATMEEFIHYWTEAEKKDAIAEELLDHGVLLDALRKEVDKDYDDFDMILHVAYDRKPLTKKERVEGVKSKGYLDKYSDICKRVLSDLLDKYMDGGVQDLEDTRILDTAPFDRIGSPKKIAKYFGGKKEFMLAVKELQNEIYSVNN